MTSKVIMYRQEVERMLNAILQRNVTCGKALSLKD